MKNRQIKQQTNMADTATARVGEAVVGVAPSLALSEHKKKKGGDSGSRSSSASTQHHEAQQRAAIDTLIRARLALQEAEKQMADNALAIATAERALQQAKMGRGVVAYRVELKRRAVEEASDAVCDALKVQRQEGFKAPARKAGLFASKEMARAMLMVARKEEEEEAEASYTHVSPSYTPVSPSSYTPALAHLGSFRRGTLWGLQEEEDEDEEAEAPVPALQGEQEAEEERAAGAGAARRRTPHRRRRSSCGRTHQPCSTEAGWRGGGGGWRPRACCNERLEEE